MNLITNASEALGEQEGVISVSVAHLRSDSGSTTETASETPQGDCIRLEVRDTGCGISEETRSRIFDPFFTTKVSGRGLGLSAVQGIVLSHDGSLSVSSALGRGCRFQISFPCAMEPMLSSSETVVSTIPDEGGIGAGTVLIVEDEDLLRLAVSKMLYKMGFSVMDAHNGSLGLDLFREHAKEIDVVLLDLTLPDMSGREILEKLRRLRPDVKVILTTVAQFVEAQSDGVFCTLVALDQKVSRYALSVAPSLPAGFDHAVVGASHEEISAPCAEAICTRSPVVIEDLAGYPLDAALRELVREAGLHSVSAWPILGSTGQILGALSIYSRRRDNPLWLNVHLVGICTDLAGIAIESRWAADRIRHLAHHDDLTGLPNRLLFNYHLPRALARAQRAGGAVGVLFLDLDRFKIINDTLGHGAGDDVLRQVSKHLLECVRATDTLARVGGDEFTVLVEQFRDPQDLGDIAQKLLAAAARTLTVNGQEYHLSGSIGIAIYPKDGADSASLLKNADIAMYRAKTSGRNNYQFYSSDINEHSVERLSLENQLRHAVARREFEVHYQPKINIQTGRIAGAEALVRWRHPQRGTLLPGEFIGVAEEVGLIGSIGRLVLDTVCADAKRWCDQGMAPIRVAINLSAQQFADSRLLEDLDSVLRETGCDPQSLEFEITESVVMTSPDKALLLLKQIKEHGITIAIDDFGTGHSSLAYLKLFPVDSVKIDHTFIHEIAANPNDLAITKAIIALGHSMGLKVVAEGVESAAQLEILRRSRCDEFQGFLFSRPVPSAEFELIVDAQSKPRVRQDGSVLATY